MASRGELIALLQAARDDPDDLSRRRIVADWLDDHGDEAGHHHEAGDFDPHAFQSIANARLYVRNVADAFCAADAAGCDAYRANAAAYDAKLADADAKVTADLAAIPADSVHLLGRYGSRWLYSNRGN